MTGLIPMTQMVVQEAHKDWVPDLELMMA